MEPKTGELFSRNYLKTSEQFSDSKRMRFRFASYLSDYFSEDSFRIGNMIEVELGITAINQYANFVPWKNLLEECSLPDFLDIITIVARSDPSRTLVKDRIRVEYDFIAFADRVFRELSIAYRIDDKGGVHPFIDATFTAEFSAVTSSLLKDGLGSASNSLVEAEESLISSAFDGRRAVRSTFDAVENIFKQIFPNETHLNASGIEKKLRPSFTGKTPNNTNGPVI